MQPVKAPAKRSQHVNATYRNIVGRNMLRAFGHRVPMCCDMLGVVGSILTIFKFEPTTPNMSQHVATRWPNARNMLRPTMLRHVALACCDRLAGALRFVRARAHLRALMTRKLCAVEMRNAILRNYLKSIFWDLQSLCLFR